MKTKLTDFERKLYSEKEWKSSADPWIIEHFEFLGFKCPRDFMRIRFFDFLNLDCVDNNRAEEMLSALSDFLFPFRDDSYDCKKRFEEKKYIRKWIAEHTPTIDNVRIKDVLFDRNLSKEGFLDIFDCITKCFYNSKEYDKRKYKYSSIHDIPRSSKS